MLNGATFEPKLIQLSTNIISVSGSTIQATVKGVGVDDSITLVDIASSTVLCTTATVKSYGVLECELDSSFDFSAGIIDVGVKEIASGITHSTCENADTTKCKLDLLTVQPKYTAVTKTSSSVIDFTGTDFDDSGAFTCQVTYANVKSDTCTISSPTAVTSQFTKGIAN